jgi:prephenate dehydrogenase
MSVQITILGLDRVGVSLGLALASAKDQLTRVGSDARMEVGKAAVKLKAIDRAVFSLPEAVSSADAVVLAIPVEEMRLTLEAIAASLKPGVVVLDTSPAPSQFLAWAKELFPSEEHYPLTFTPSLNPAYLFDTDYSLNGAHADLFQNSSIFISNPIGVDASAIQFAENMARLIGATPVFSDTAEVDGLVSKARLLPELLSAALVGATMGKPGWLEARKLAGGDYAQATQALLGLEGSKSPGQLAMTNRAGALSGIDVLVEELQDLRDMIAAGEGEKLDNRLNQARAQRETWLGQRLAAKWESAKEKGPALPTIGDTLGKLIGLRPRGQRK